MKNICIFIIIVVTVSCNQSNSQYHYINNATEILEVLIEEGIEEVYNLPYHLSPIFDTNFTVTDLSNMKEMLSIDDDDTYYMIKQHNTYKERDIDVYIGELYRSKISYNKPSSDEVYAVIDPPLFTKEYKKCIVYLTIIQQIDGSFKWDEKLFIFEKKNKWELTGHFSRN